MSESELTLADAILAASMIGAILFFVWLTWTAGRDDQ